MAENEEPETDEHGLVVQKYEAKVLVVLPTDGFGEQTLRYARSMLYNELKYEGMNGVATRTIQNLIADRYLLLPSAGVVIRAPSPSV